MANENRSEPVNSITLGDVQAVPVRSDGVRYTGKEMSNQQTLSEWVKRNPKTVIDDYQIH